MAFHISPKFRKLTLFFLVIAAFTVFTANLDWTKSRGEIAANKGNEKELLEPKVNNDFNTETQKEVNVEPPAIKIKSVDDLSKLINGEIFALLGESQEGDVNLLLMVKKIDKQSKFTQIEAFDENGVAAVITLTNSFTNVFIKTANSIFEYAGNDFSGTVNQVTDLNLADDMYIRETSAISVQEKPKLKKLASEMSDATFVMVDAEKFPESRKLATVDNLPTFAVFKSGQFVNQTQTNKFDVLKDLIDEASSN